ncbi:MAG: RAMP superfamily CRISPR-associated protein [bacterium]|nr:RAMP superfamily CRISPR-associated protein [bacterium]
MHGRLYNQLDLEIAIVPQTPLLIKSGQKASIDPALPDMQFVRTRRRTPSGDIDEVVYIPGSSLRGVVRAHAERLLRTLDAQSACYVDARQLCLRQKNLKEDQEPADHLYRESCYACKLFGNTGIASRVQMSDLYPAVEPLSESRFGVAIDRITGAVAVGPFDLEVVTDARFEGRIVLRNFTIGQLGLLGAALLDIADGLVALGHAKSRGLGRVRIEFVRAQFRFAQQAAGAILGVGAIAPKDVRNSYRLPESDTLDMQGLNAAQRNSLYYQADSDSDEQIRKWLTDAAPRWVQEVQNAR